MAAIGTEPTAIGGRLARQAEPPRGGSRVACSFLLALGIEAIEPRRRLFGGLGPIIIFPGLIEMRSRLAQSFAARAVSAMAKWPSG